MFNGITIDWAAIYCYLCIIPKCDLSIQNLKKCVISQYIFFAITLSTRCSFCNLHKKTPFHIFYECDRSNAYGWTYSNIFIIF